MQRQRGELVPIGDALLRYRRAGEVYPRSLAPGAALFHRGRSGEPAWKAVSTGEPVELTRELGEKIGLMEEDVGTMEEIKAARYDPSD